MAVNAASFLKMGAQHSLLYRAEGLFGANIESCEILVGLGFQYVVFTCSCVDVPTCLPYSWINAVNRAFFSLALLMALQ